MPYPNPTQTNFSNPQMQNPYQQRPIYPMTQNVYGLPMLYGGIVNGENDIRPNQIPMDGSSAYFPTADRRYVIAKFWLPNGTIGTDVYERVQPQAQTQAQTQQPDQAQPPQQGQAATNSNVNDMLEKVVGSLSKLSERLDKLEKALTE